MKKTATLLVALVIIITTMKAAVNPAPPRLMSYQTVIRNASGTLVANQAIGVRISILQAPTDTAVYLETDTTTTNADGLASFSIGGGTVISGSMGTINWGSSNYYVKSEIDPTGGTNYTISGTSQLLSVPYAFYAGSAASSSFPWTLSGNNIYNINPGNVGIGTSSPYDLLDVRGSMAIGTYAGTDTAPANSLIVSGAVGIGISTPYGTFHVSGGTNLMANIQSSSGVGTWLAIGNTSTGGTYYQFISTGSGNGQGAGKLCLTTGSNAAGTAGTVATFEGSTGNVGFGTTKPGNRLDVNGAVAIGAYAGTDTAAANSLIVSGNVGIGTPIPHASLDVESATSPAVKIVDGTQAQGNVLTSDSAGNAKWKPSGAKAYGFVYSTGLAGTSYNVDSVVHVSTGIFTIHTSTNVSVNAFAGNFWDTNTYGFISYYPSGGNTISVVTRNGAGTLVDNDGWSFVIFDHPIHFEA